MASFRGDAAVSSCAIVARDRANSPIPWRARRADDR
jgi:hypothetical protein